VTKGYGGGPVSDEYEEEEEIPVCPECGHILSTDVVIDKKTGQIVVHLYCEGPGDDVYAAVIFTGFTQDDLDMLFEEGQTIRREAAIKLLKREPEPYEEWEEEEGEENLELNF